MTAITGRGPDCPDCGAIMQRVAVNGTLVWRCPWTTARNLRAAALDGEEALACDWPLDGPRNVDGVRADP